MHEEMHTESGYSDKAQPIETKNLSSDKDGMLITGIIVVVTIGVVLGYHLFSSNPQTQKNSTAPTTSVEKPIADTVLASKTEPALLATINTQLEVIKPVTGKTPIAKEPSSIVKINSKLDPADKASWSLNLISLMNKAYATEHLAALTSAGYAAETAVVSINGTTWYRIHIPGFVTVRDANKFASRMANETTYRSTWVSRH